jgi:hypothetical protein
MRSREEITRCVVLSFFPQPFVHINERLGIPGFEKPLKFHFFMCAHLFPRLLSQVRGGEIFSEGKSSKREKSLITADRRRSRVMLLVPLAIYPVIPITPAIRRRRVASIPRRSAVCAVIAVIALAVRRMDRHVCRHARALNELRFESPREQG